MLKIDSYYPGFVIIKEGQEINNAYVIQKGTVEVFRKISETEVVSLAKLGQGQMFGEMSLFGNKKSTASVRAITEVQAQIIDKKVFEEYLNQTPPLIKMLLEILADRLQKTSQKLLLANYKEQNGHKHSKEAEFSQIDFNKGKIKD